MWCQQPNSPCKREHQESSGSCMSKGELNHSSLKCNTVPTHRCALGQLCLRLLFVQGFNKEHFVELPAALSVPLAVPHLSPLMLRKGEFRAKSRPCSLSGTNERQLFFPPFKIVFVLIWKHWRLSQEFTENIWYFHIFPIKMTVFFLLMSDGINNSQIYFRWLCFVNTC